MKRPNIVIITTDQHRGDCLGVAGRRILTPHLDRLSHQGTRFDACMTAGPVCQPARASILTGLLPLTHGVRDNGIDLDPAVAQRGFAARLSAAGYSTGFVGKAHFSTKITFAPTGRPECRSSSAEYGPDWHGPYMGFDVVELMLGTMTEEFAPLEPPAGQHFERWFAPRRDDALERWAARLPPDTGAPQIWTSALPTAWHPTSWVADRTIEFLTRQGPKRPFCVWASIPDPHHPFDCPVPWAYLHAPQSVERPIAENPDAGRPWWHAAARDGSPALADAEMLRFRRSKSRMPTLQPEQAAQMVSNYYGMIALADHAVGRILAALDSLALSNATVVVFLSDHGDLLGDHGLTLKGPTLFDGLLRVPLVVAGPGVSAGGLVDEPVSTVDLAPTLCDLAGAPVDGGSQGRSLVPFLRGEPAKREPVYCEWQIDERRFGQKLDLRCVRTRDAKLTIERHSGAGELYDLATDPEENVNCFDSAAAAPLRRRMEDLLEARPGVVCERFDAPVGMS